MQGGVLRDVSRTPGSRVALKAEGGAQGMQRPAEAGKGKETASRKERSPANILIFSSVRPALDF